MELPRQKCPRTEKRNCKICGPYLGWVDCRNPSRMPTAAEWGSCCREFQDEHDALRQREFNSLKLVPKEKYL
jgi:hypothetical protein